MKIRIIILTIISLLILSCDGEKSDEKLDLKAENKTELKFESGLDLEKDYFQSAEYFAKEILKENLRVHSFDLSNTIKPRFIEIFKTNGLESVVGYSNVNYPKNSEPNYYEHFILFVATFKDVENAKNNFEQIKSDSKYGISINDLEIKESETAKFLKVGIKPGGLITQNGKYVFSLVETCRKVPIEGNWDEYENKFIGFITENNKELEVLNSDCGNDKYYLETIKASR